MDGVGLFLLVGQQKESWNLVDWLVSKLLSICLKNSRRHSSSWYVSKTHNKTKLLFETKPVEILFYPKKKKKPMEILS